MKLYIIMSYLKQSFFNRDTISVAQDLLGKTIVRTLHTGEILKGIIVETEAYLYKNDPACHAWRGKTRRNEVMFGAAGYSYVYFIYGNHFCFNVVTEKEGIGAAVLIRAAEPIMGIDAMKTFRKKEDLISIANGPGKLAQAFDLRRTENGIKLIPPNLYIEDGKKIKDIVTTTRIGIKNGADLPLRFYIRDNKFVSKK